MRLTRAGFGKRHTFLTLRCERSEPQGRGRDARACILRGAASTAAPQDEDRAACWQNAAIDLACARTTPGSERNDTTTRSRSPDRGRRAGRHDGGAGGEPAGAERAALREIGSGRRHRIDVGRHALDSRQSSEPKGRLRRQRRKGRGISGRAGWKLLGPRAAHGVSENRAGRDRLSGAQHRREVRAVRTASGLSQQHERRRGQRPRHHSAAVRRTPAGRGLHAAAPADRRIHAVRRHDDRQGRHPAAARPLQVAGQFQLRRQAAGALRRRPAALPARHAADDGQRPHRAAVLQPAQARRGNPVRRADRRRRCPRRPRRRRGDQHRGRRDLRQRQEGRRARHRRLRT